MEYMIVKKNSKGTLDIYFEEYIGGKLYSATINDTKLINKNKTTTKVECDLISGSIGFEFKINERANNEAAIEFNEIEKSAYINNQIEVMTTSEMLKKLNVGQRAVMVKSDYYEQPVIKRENGDIVYEYNKSPLNMTGSVLNALWAIVDIKN